MGVTAKLSTVNIIDVKDISDMSIASFVSYPDTPSGNKLAEALFQEWVQEAAGDETVDEETMKSYIEEGRYEIGAGCILLIHSTP